MTVEYRPPRNEAELEDAFQCTARAFGGNLAFFTNIVRHDPWFHIDNTRACFLDGRVVSLVQIFDRPIRIGRSVLRMGGIGSVGTDPDHRRAGHSLNLLKDSVRYMEGAGYDLSVLFTGIPGHYGRAGWVIHPVHTTRLTLPGAIPELHGDWAVEPCEPARDLPGLVTLYDRCNAARTGTLVRNDAYWTNQRKWREYDPSFFSVARKGDEVVAYLKAGRWSLGEFGWRSGEERAMQDLCLRLFRRAADEGAREVETRCPAEWCGMFEALGCGVRRRENSSTMVRIVRWGSLLRKIAPLLETRLRASAFSQWVGSVRVRYEADAQTLSVKDGTITVSGTNTPPDIDLVVSQEQLLRMLFGNLRAEDLAFSNHLSFSEGTLGLLNALFPPDELFLWGTDGF